MRTERAKEARPEIETELRTEIGGWLPHGTRPRSARRARTPAKDHSCRSSGRRGGYQLGMPAFMLEGKAFIWFSAAAKHCALYGVSEGDADLSGYDTSGRGTLRFEPNRPLPAALIKKLVRAR